MLLAGADRGADSPECQRYAESACTGIQERQIETVQVVVLDYVRVEGFDGGDQSLDQVSLSRVAGAIGLQHFRRAGRLPHGHHEDPVTTWIETRRL